MVALAFAGLSLSDYAHNGLQYLSWKGTCSTGSWKAKHERTQTLQNTPRTRLLCQNIQHTLLQEQVIYGWTL